MEKQGGANVPPPLHHHSIGKIQGRYGKGVVQYLGMKYVTVNDRFAEATIIEYSGNENIVATKHG